jgi:lipopolysaccharide export LptBFGC system permease protein LptF
MNQQPEPVAFYESDITPEDIPIRLQEKYKSLLSSSQLAQLAAKGTRVKDLAALYSQKHFRITDPIINMVMLMVALPILVCRDPKAMKTAILISFVITSACWVVTFACKMVATEVIFNQVRPELWPWVPVFIFLPIAFIELDSMRT